MCGWFRRWGIKSRIKWVLIIQLFFLIQKRQRFSQKYTCFFLNRTPIFPLKFFPLSRDGGGGGAKTRFQKSVQKNHGFLLNVTHFLVAKKSFFFHKSFWEEPENAWGINQCLLHDFGVRGARSNWGQRIPWQPGFRTLPSSCGGGVQNGGRKWSFFQDWLFKGGDI